MSLTMIEHPTTLTYPISPDYVKAGHGGTGWTVQRALAEFIANALDEDTGARVTYAGGTLTIEDNGPGIPEEGLLLGYSPKGDDQIGQFGEGSKIGALVLARDPSVGAIHIETVGYAFIPSVERRRILDGVAPRRSDEAPEVLVYSFYPSTRTRGTKVSVEVSKTDATEAMSRFRHLTEAGYVAPQTAQVITTGKSGRLYVGGVFVTTVKGLHASYDFPLMDAKSAQNRDRTVIATEVITDLVGGALSTCLDIDVHRTFVKSALAGGRLPEAERYFGRVSDPRIVTLFRQIARETWGDAPTFWTQPGDEEATLSLMDKNVTLVSTKLEWAANARLMDLLGVRMARVAQRTLAQDEKKGTKFVALSRLTGAERAVLNGALDVVKAVFGPEAFDVVKVYGETSRHMACALGFYDPATGAIALSRDILTDTQQTLDTLLHECAHRLAHRRGGDHQDRSRGFDHQLTTMLGFAVARLAQTVGLTSTSDAPDYAETHVAMATAREDLAVAAQTSGVTIEVPAERQVLAEVMQARLDAAKATYGVKTGPALMRAIGRHPGNWSLLTSARPAGWRNREGSMSPSMVTDYRAHQVIGAAFGISAPALWLAHMACEAHAYGKRGADISGPWKRAVGDAAPLLVADLRAEGMTDVADLIVQHAEGNGTPADLRALALRLISAERV